MRNEAHWSKEDFLAFLLVHAMHADFTLTDEEIEFANNTVGEDRIERMQKLYDPMSDFEVSELISEISEHCCKTTVDKDAIVQQLEELFSQDRDFSDVEKAFLLALRRLL